MKSLVLLIATVITIAYPFLVYFGIQHASPAIFAILFLALAVIKFQFAPNKRDLSQIGILLVATLYSASLAISNSELLLRLYPVVISLSIAAIFALSLRHTPSIESIARAAGKPITTNAKGYLRKLTMLWSLLLLLNGIFSLYLALFASLAHWTLYCGFIAYALFGGVFVLELFYRRHYIRKYGA